MSDLKVLECETICMAFGRNKRSCVRIHTEKWRKHEAKNRRADEWNI